MTSFNGTLEWTSRQGNFLAHPRFPNLSGWVSPAEGPSSPRTPVERQKQDAGHETGNEDCAILQRYADEYGDAHCGICDVGDAQQVHSRSGLRSDGTKECGQVWVCAPGSSSDGVSERAPQVDSRKTRKNIPHRIEHPSLPPPPPERCTLIHSSFLARTCRTFMGFGGFVRRQSVCGRMRIGMGIMAALPLV